jgi:bifunctional non-homologous end joining protein LigD
MSVSPTRGRTRTHQTSMPSGIAPMLATPGALPENDAGYAYEIKWDGIRAIAYVDRGVMRLESRNLIDITARYPELTALGKSCRTRRLILDGEIVAFDDDGRPSFSRLQTRMQLTREQDVRRTMHQAPIMYVIFDVLFADGRTLMPLPYLERRQHLHKMELAGAHWQTPEYVLGNGRMLLDAISRRRMEGIIAKRLNSTYDAGRRSGAWIKIKKQPRQELVIGGWMEGQGRRSGTIGSLLLGYYDVPSRRRGKNGQKFVYAGKAGTGFTDKALDELDRLLRPLARQTSPFDEGKPPRGAHFVEPQLVGEFEFTEWTHLGSARHPSFKGLREDKNPREVVREDTPDLNGRKQ